MWGVAYAIQSAIKDANLYFYLSSKKFAIDTLRDKIKHILIEVEENNFRNRERNEAEFWNDLYSLFYYS